jgi:hypothetical protein
MNKNNFIVELNEFPELTTTKWREIYTKVRKEKLYASKHDYGLKVLVKDIPELEEFYNKFKLKDYFWILLTNGKSNSRFYVHIDGRFDDNSPGGINWPLENCDERSTTIWVRPLKEEYYEISANSYTLEEHVETKELFRYHCMNDQPILFRSNLWHYAINETNIMQWRVMIKWELIADSWEDLKNEFKSHFK